MTRRPKDLGASTQARLRNLARERGDDTQVVLTQFVLERLLHRLSVSPHRDQFLLKGAMLFVAWTGLPHRTTRDLDLLGRGAPEESRILQLIRAVCGTEVAPDGVAFDADSLRLSRIREDQTYEGWRAELSASLGTARIDVQVDIGFGDAVHPAPEMVTLPPLLDLPAATLLAYPRPTVVAEKFEAMVALGLLNSRMKDFFDLHYMAANFAFERPELALAIRATFDRRGTRMPTEVPVALRNEFATDTTKQVQWRAFLKRTRLVGTASLDAVVTEIRRFLWPVLDPATEPDATHWSAGGPWRTPSS